MPTIAAEFQGAWAQGLERVWVGPEYYANRLQDWRVRNGRLECIEASASYPLQRTYTSEAWAARWCR